MEEQTASVVWSVLKLGVFATLIVLALGVAYLGWRGRIFSQSQPARLSSSKVDDETADYLERMAEILGVHQRQSHSLGSDRFDEDVYRQLIEDIEHASPPEGNRLDAQHRAYRDSVATFVDARRETASHLRDSARHVSRISGQEVVDCATASKAQEVMRSYRQSEDKQLKALIERCAAEKVAYEAMQKRVADWRTASYFLKYGGR